LAVKQKNKNTIKICKQDKKCNQKTKNMKDEKFIGENLLKT